MPKIPVVETIAFAYRFLFQHIASIVGIAWLPAVLSAAAGYGSQFYAYRHPLDINAADPQASAIYLAVSLGSVLVTLLVSSITAVGITRQALGLKSEVPLVYFPLGRTEWRMIQANLLYVLGACVLLGLAFLIAMVAFMLAGLSLDAPANVRPTPAAILAGLIFWFVFGYAVMTILRMGFLLPATVVSEEKRVLGRSHELTHSNFWRVLAVIAALGIPILLLVLAGESVVLRSALGPDFLNLGTRALTQQASAAMEQKLLPWEIFNAVIFVLASGLIYSGAAFAYRALTQPQKKLP
jgi:hypothetical protein